ncbi:hypothetical protein F2Q68_00041273 [Brassica cretica]|uniref:Uncharacterized protein n=1 Tax=Brassica cretica TaxID=69181 RepID=A0A8S9MQY2_BRACR|nr:hypothetical protein F2Q68_00041273 [Brassica cretica]
MVVYQSNSANKRSRGFRVRSLSRFAETRVQSRKLPNHEDTYPEPDTVYQPGLVAQLAVNFFAQLMPTGEELPKRDKVESVDSVSDNGELHCLDVFHRSLFKSTWTLDKKSLKKSISSRKQQLIHCVTELKEAGVKFRRKKTDKLWDIEFKKGYLKIPKLLIHDSTKSLFSNLIAFEQCHANSGNDITSYVIFMDNLINSAEEVSYLHHCGIIEHWLGSAFEVADLFNRLCKEVVFDPRDSYLSKLSGEFIASDQLLKQKE